MASPTIEELVQLIQQLRLENRDLLQQVRGQPSSPPKSQSRPLEPKVALPAKFDGTRSQFRGFVNQVKLVFHLQPQRYPSSSSRVGLLGTLLTGSALKWFSPLLEKNSPALSDWDEFIREFEATFGDPDRERAAITKLRRLTQGSRAASDYASEFRLLACDIGWDDAAFRDQFRHGLRDDVKDLLLTLEEPKNLEEAISQAVRCDNRLFERRQERRPRLQAPSMRAATVEATRPVPTDGPVPMQIDATRPRGPLTLEERQRRFRENLCLYCGELGHKAQRCPNKRRRVQVDTADLASASAAESGNELVPSE